MTERLFEHIVPLHRPGALRVAAAENLDFLDVLRGLVFDRGRIRDFAPGATGPQHGELGELVGAGIQGRDAASAVTTVPRI